MIILLVVSLSNIIWILVYNINWILEDWCVCLSYGLKHNLVLPKYFISNPSYMMTTCFDVSYEMYKIHGILLWVHRWNHQDGRHPSVEGTRLVSCTTINLTISSLGVTWLYTTYVAIYVLIQNTKCIGTCNPNLSKSNLICQLLI